MPLELAWSCLKEIKLSGGKKKLKNKIKKTLKKLILDNSRPGLYPGSVPWKQGDNFFSSYIFIPSIHLSSWRFLNMGGNSQIWGLQGDTARDDRDAPKFLYSILEFPKFPQISLEPMPLGVGFPWWRELE